MQEEVLLGDETPLRVLSLYENGERKNGYVWLVRTSRFAVHPLVMYRFETSRKYECHSRFIEGFTGYFQSDAYGAYPGLPGIISVHCFAHARKRFVDAAQDGELEKDVSAAKLAVDIFDRMFYLESLYRDESPDERLRRRTELVLPEMQKLNDLLDKIEPITLKKSLLGKAITYCRNQWEYMMNVFKDGRLDLSNNLSERSIKVYVIDRKNFLFANTCLGGDASTIYLTLIESGKENGKDPMKYVTWVLQKLPSMDPSKPESYDVLLPWNAPDSFNVPQNRNASETQPANGSANVVA